MFLLIQIIELVEQAHKPPYLFKTQNIYKAMPNNGGEFNSYTFKVELNIYNVYGNTVKHGLSGDPSHIWKYSQTG